MNLSWMMQSDKKGLSFKGFLCLTATCISVLFLLGMLSAWVGNINIIALLVYLAFLVMMFIWNTPFLLNYFWLIVMSSLGVLGVFVIESFPVYLVELEESGAYRAAFIPQVLFVMLMYGAMEGYRLWRADRPVKTVTPRQIVLNIPGLNRRNVQTLMLSVAIAAVVILQLSVIDRPYFLGDLDRVTYNNQVNWGWARSLKSYLPLFIPVALMCFREGNRKMAIAYAGLMCLYWLWIGDKFGAYFLGAFILLLGLIQHVNTDTVRKAVMWMLVLFAGLFGVVFVQRAVVNGQGLGEFWGYLSHRLAQQGEVWWSVFGQESAAGATGHLNELGPEWQVILNGGSIADKTSYGQWKMMLVTSRYSDYAYYRIGVGNPYTATTAASLFYYFGWAGPIVFYPVFGVAYGALIEKARDSFNKNSVFEAMIWVKVIIVMHDLVGASNIHYLLSYKGLLYIGLGVLLWYIRTHFVIKSGEVMDKDILLLFEHKNRELESVILLEEKLKQAGKSVAVRQIGWDANLALADIRAKVIVSPWYYDDADAQRLRQYQSSSADGSLKIVNLHCEQLTTSAALQFLLPTGESVNSMHLCWGESFASELRKKDIPDELISITGSPRLDFFREEMRYTCKSRKELSQQFGLDADAKWVLFIGNFSGGFISDEAVKDLTERGYLTAKETKEMSLKAYHCTLEWMEETCKHFNDGTQIIYRPHPSEPLTKEIEKLEQQYSNLHVIKELAIRDWIVNADLGVMWNSTSSVEATSGGLPIISLRPFPLPENMQIPLLENAVQVTTCEQLLECVKNVDRSCYSEFNAKLNEAVDYYYKHNDKLATELTAEEIIKVLENENFPTLISQPLSVWKKMEKVIHFCGKRLLHKLKILKKIKGYDILGDDYVSAEERRAYQGRIIKK